MKNWWKHALYYLSIPLAFVLLWLAVECLAWINPYPGDLGVAIVLAFVVCFVAMPLLTVVMMRLSMLKWVVDPFAAGMVSLVLWVFMVITGLERYGTLGKAVVAIDTETYLILVLVFLLGLVASISPRRARGDHLPGRIWRKLFHKRALSE